MLIPMAQAAGVIDDAPSVASILMKTFEFLLRITGIVAILGIVFAGMLYLFAAGDRHRLALAKKVFAGTVIGAVIVFGAVLIIRQLATFFT